MGGDKASWAGLVGGRTGNKTNKTTRGTGRSGQGTESRAQTEGCSR
jgi:hypothetical protein